MDKGIERQDITRPAKPKKAAGRPGEKPRWTSGAKTIVGASVRPESRIWVTINNGTIAEVYHPDVDQANTRSIRLVVSGEDFVADEIWDADHSVEWLAPGAPGCRIEARSKSGAYQIAQEIVPDPMRDTLLLRGKFQPADGRDLHLYVILEAHVGDEGAHNDAWAGEYKGVPMVFAKRGAIFMACASSPNPLRTRVGYRGTSDAYTLLSSGKPLGIANVAPDGNVAMTLELDYKSSGDGSFVLAVAFGADAAEAGQQARAGLLEPYAATRDLAPGATLLIRSSSKRSRTRRSRRRSSSASKPDEPELC